MFFRKKKKSDAGSANKPAAPPGRISQMMQVFHVTRKEDPKLIWLMLGVALGVLAVGIGIGFLIGHPIIAGFSALPLAILGAAIVMARRAERLMYAKAEGQPGAALMAMKMVRSGWTVTEEPVAMDARNKDFVFRAVGRAGVLLVGEGEVTRIQKLLTKEAGKTERLLPGVAVTTLSVGKADSQVPLKSVAKKMMRMKKALTVPELAEVNKRLQSLGGVRPPIPHGIDPTKVRQNRRSLRGR